MIKQLSLADAGRVEELTVADPRKGALRTCPSKAPINFIFMQLLVKKNNRLVLPFRVGKFWVRHWYGRVYIQGDRMG